MTGPEQNAFQNALSDFTFEAACGGAVRHLADSGCTAKQIIERLDYPVSGERVRKALYKHLCDRRVIIEQSPEEEFPEVKTEYILEYNSYGKPSYRRKNTEEAGGILPESDSAGTTWKETVYKPASGCAEPVSAETSQGASKGSGQGMLKKVFRNSNQSDTGKITGYPGRGAALAAFLTDKYTQEKEKAVYISCDFGIPDSEAAKGILLLNGRQQEYLEGIPWPRRRVYHQLDHRMEEILCSLYEQHAYEGVCYFLPRKEKLFIL